MSSRIDIQKRCKWCNAVFTAHKTTTEYCSHRCANLAYKDRVRKQRIESLQHELGKSIKTPPNLNKEYLTDISYQQEQPPVSVRPSSSRLPYAAPTLATTPL